MFNILKVFVISSVLIIDIGLIIVFYLLVKYSNDLNDDDYDEYKKNIKE